MSCSWNGTLQEDTVAIVSNVAPGGNFVYLTPQVLSLGGGCSLYTYNLKDIMLAPNPALIVKEWMSNWKTYSVGDSTERLLKYFFATPLTNNTSCSQVDSYWAQNPQYANLYSQTCLPIAASDVNGEVARMLTTLYPKDAAQIMTTYCQSTDINVGNSKDPRCSCINKYDPSGYYTYMNGNNGVMLPTSCWFMPCRTPETFYNDPTIPPCDSVPSCSAINNIIVQAGGTYDNNSFKNVISCDGSVTTNNKVLQYIQNHPAVVIGAIVGTGALLLVLTVAFSK